MKLILYTPSYAASLGSGVGSRTFEADNFIVDVFEGLTVITLVGGEGAGSRLYPGVFPFLVIP